MGAYKVCKHKRPGARKTRVLGTLNENDRVLWRNKDNMDYGSVKETKEEGRKDRYQHPSQHKPTTNPEFDPLISEAYSRANNSHKNNSCTSMINSLPHKPMFTNT